MWPVIKLFCILRPNGWPDWEGRDIHRWARTEVGKATLSKVMPHTGVMGIPVETCGKKNKSTTLTQGNAICNADVHDKRAAAGHKLLSLGLQHWDKKWS